MVSRELNNFGIEASPLIAIPYLRLSRAAQSWRFSPKAWANSMPKRSNARFGRLFANWKSASCYTRSWSSAECGTKAKVTTSALHT